VGVHMPGVTYLDNAPAKLAIQRERMLPTLRTKHCAEVDK